MNRPHSIPARKTSGDTLRRKTQWLALARENFWGVVCAALVSLSFLLSGCGGSPNTPTGSTPQPPVASAGGPYTGAPGTAISFSAAGSSDPKGEVLTYAWNFGDGNTGTGVSTSHVYAAAGTFTVTVKVTNTDNLSSTATTTATITAAAQPPTANAGGPYSGTTATAVQFTGAASSDPKGEALTYAWVFGDGSTGTGVSPTHIYASAGTFTVKLTVTNTDNLSASATATAAITVPPQPPVANAGGPYSGTAGTALQFSGAASTDPKNETLTYAWTFGDGGTATGVAPSHTYSAAGTFTVTLKVTNTDNLSASATTTATIAGLPPVANAGGPYTGAAGLAVSFNGSGSSDPRGETLTYAWTFGDGGTATTASPTHTYTSPGTYNVTLKVTNTDNLSATATATATISAQAPVANAGGPYTGTAGTAIALNGSASSDPRNEALTYAWTFGDGSSGTGVSPAHTYTSAGTYTVTLTVTNTDNASASATTTATIAAAPQPPVANAGGPYTGTAGTAVNFNGSGSADPKGETLTYAWDFGDGNTGTGATPSHIYAAAGTFTVKLTVTNTDKLSASASSTATIAVAPQAPVAAVGGPYTGTAGTAVSFSGVGSSDPKGETLTYAWNFGDGSTGSGVTTNHTYASAGTYSVSLTVTNTDNLTANATSTATITAGPQAPTANAGGPYSGTAGSPIAFSGVGSSDPKGETLSYAWNFGDGTTGSGVSPTHTYTASGTFKITLTVTNTDNLSASASAVATVNPAAAQPPVANAGGPYSGTTGTAVAFNASASKDPNNETLSFAWTFGDGGSGTGAMPTHIYTSAGSFTVTVTVTNTDGASASATTTAVVTAAPQAPTASAGGPYTGVAGTAVEFNGTGSSDPVGETLTYAWNFGDGGTGTGASPSHTYTAPGTFTVTLTVTNTDNLSNTATTSATISAVVLQNPTANAGGPYTGTAGTAVNFSGSGSSDPKGETLSYAWNFGDGSSGTGVLPSHTYASAGTYTVTLTVTNTDNLSNSATTKATISAGAAQPPVAKAGGPYSGIAGTAIAFNGSASTDPKGEALTYLWSFGDGSTGTGPAPSHTYATAGNYSVTLTVTNTDGLSGNASSTAAISAPPGQTPISNPGGPYTGSSGIAVNFNGAASSDPANPNSGPFALTFSWNFGDGGTGAGATPTHIYSSAGTYKVTLTVQSASGLTATASTTATITTTVSLSNVPTPVPAGPYSGTTTAAINFSGSGSTDPNNLALTYLWDFGDGSTANGATVSHTYGTAGVFSVELTVFNGTASNSATTTATVTAGAAPALTVNAGGPYTVAVNQPLTLNGSQTNNPDGHQQTFTWDFGDGTAGSGTQANHVYTAQGAYTATLTVSDSTGVSGSATAQVTVGAPPAEVVVASAGGPYSDVTGHAITFDASASTDNLSNPLTYTWNFGDGSSGTGVNATHAYNTAGSYTATVTASSSSASASATATVNISNALKVTITSPTANALFASTTTTVMGTISAPNLTVTVNGIAAQVSGTSFTATGVSLREGVNLIAATATDGNGGVGTGTVSVVMDATAPTAIITSPVSGSTVSTSTISVAGLVNDIVTGTVGSNQVTVTVNGLPAQVSNRSYMLPSLLLNPGSNTITVVATDMVGNTSKTSATVQFVPPTSQLSLNVFSGNNQTSGAHSLLSQPLVVQLLSAAGTPVAGRPITFTVTRSDGMVEVLPNIAQSVYVNTDATGKASVLFQLGSRSGLGINQVTATTPGAAGSALFLATSTTGAPALVHAIHGENQRGLLGEPLPEAFQVLVQDAYGNPVQGATINFTSTSGDGTLDSSSVATDSNGRAQATLTIGQQEGVGNYVVTADFAGDTNQPATFAASAYAPGPVASTSLSGVVLDNGNSPIPNATVRVLNTTLSTVSDVNGHFTISGAPVGTVTFSVDGSTSTRTETFPFLSFVIQDLPGQNNTLNKPIYLPFIQADSAQTVGGSDPVTLTMPGVPGVAFTIAPNSVTFPDGTTVGKLSLSQVKSDMVPMPPANGSSPALIWTLQPAGTRFSVPVQITLPNTAGLPPGRATEMYQYDHDLEQFVSAGTGHVSADGSVVVSDPGFGITKAGWGHDYDDPPEEDCPESCTTNNQCITPHILVCGCKYTSNNGQACGSNSPKSCQLPGVCVGSSCSGIRKNPGFPCDDGVYCTINDQCQADGTCQGTPVKDQPGSSALSPDALKFKQVFESDLQPLSAFINNYGAFVKVEPIFNPESNETRTCCESKQMMDVLKRQTKVTVGLELSTDQIPIPGTVYEVPFVGGVTAYVQFVLALTGNAALNVDDCLGTSCWSGGVNMDGTIEVGVKTFAPGIGISGGGQAGLTANLVVGCHALITTIGSTDVKAVVTFTLGSGRSVAFEKVIIPAQTITQSTLPWAAY